MTADNNRFAGLELESASAPSDPIPAAQPRMIEVEGAAPIIPSGVRVQQYDHSSTPDGMYAKGGAMAHAPQGLAISEGGIRALAKASGQLDFTVSMLPTYFENEDGEQIRTGYSILKPSNSDTIWHSGVSDQYEVVQPLDGLLPLERLNDHALENGLDEIQLERVGTWKGGRLIFAQTRPHGFGFDLPSGPQSYLGRSMVFNGLDGKNGWGVGFGVENTSCSNAMRLNMTRCLTLKHTTGINDKIGMIAKLLATAPEAFAAEARKLQTWAAIKLADADAFKLLARIFPKQEDGTYSTTTLGKVESFLSLYQDGTVGQRQVVPNAAPGTIEGFARASTAYNTHIRAIAGGRDGNPDAAWDYLMGGAGASWQSRVEREIHQHVSLAS